MRASNKITTNIEKLRHENTTALPKAYIVAHEQISEQISNSGCSPNKSDFATKEQKHFHKMPKTKTRMPTSKQHESVHSTSMQKKFPFGDQKRWGLKFSFLGYSTLFTVEDRRVYQVSLGRRSGEAKDPNPDACAARNTMTGTVSDARILIGYLPGRRTWRGYDFLHLREQGYLHHWQECDSALSSETRCTPHSRFFRP